MNLRVYFFLSQQSFFSNSINWMVFVMETHCVYCEAETEFLYPYMKINMQGTSDYILRCYDYITMEHCVVHVYI
jgi:hypothetical protein